MAPYHVDRSKMFVLERFKTIAQLDEERIAHAIEFTRFPATFMATENEIDEEGSLLRAADLIGQLGDPHYIRKSNALFYEFEEIGLNKERGYEIASGYGRQVSAILLELHFSPHQGCDPLSQCHLEGTAVDCKPPKQRFSC